MISVEDSKEAKFTLCSIPFPRCTTSGQPGCCRDDRLSKPLPYHGDDVVGHDVAVVGELFLADGAE